MHYKIMLKINNKFILYNNDVRHIDKVRAIVQEIINNVEVFNNLNEIWIIDLKEVVKIDNIKEYLQEIKLNPKRFLGTE